MLLYGPQGPNWAPLERMQTGVYEGCDLKVAETVVLHCHWGPYKSWKSPDKVAEGITML